MDHFHWLKWLKKRSLAGKSFVFRNIEIVCGDKRVSFNDKILRTHCGYFAEIFDKCLEIPSEIRGTFINYVVTLLGFLGAFTPRYRTLFPHKLDPMPSFFRHTLGQESKIWTFFEGLRSRREKTTITPPFFKQKIK